MPIPVECQGCGVTVLMAPSAVKRGYKCCSMICRDTVRRSLTINDVDGTKRCGKCEEWKHFDQYAPARSEKAGAHKLQSYCNTCTLVVDRAFKERNKEYLREYRRKWHQNAPKRKKRALTEAQKIVKRAKQKEYRESNMDKILMWNRIRRLRERAAGSPPHRYDIGRLLCHQDGRCTYCQELLSDYHIDHMMPVSRGGRNDLENLQLLCAPCNIKKRALTHEEYSASLLAQTIAELQA